MRLPTDIEITSHRPVVGALIVACKKLVGLIVGPYLRNVFEKERLITGERFNSLESRLDEGLRSVDSRFITTTADILNLRNVFEKERLITGERFNSLEKRLGEEVGRLRLRREELAKTVLGLSQEMVLQKRRLELILDELGKKESLP